MNNFVNVMADCQYSRDSTFGIIASSMEKMCLFWPFRKIRYETKEIGKPNVEIITE